MRFIGMIGSKQHPLTIKREKMLLNIRKKEDLPQQDIKVTEEIKEDEKQLLITGIKALIKKEQLHLQFVGENIEENIKYDWVINFYDRTITPSSIGSKLVLSKSNTLKYVKADKTSVNVSNGNYTSPTFSI